MMLFTCFSTLKYTNIKLPRMLSFLKKHVNLTNLHSYVMFSIVAGEVNWQKYWFAMLRIRQNMVSNVKVDKCIGLQC